MITSLLIIVWFKPFFFTFFLFFLLSCKIACLIFWFPSGKTTNGEQILPACWEPSLAVNAAKLHKERDLRQLMGIKGLVKRRQHRTLNLLFTAQEGAVLEHVWDGSWAVIHGLTSFLPACRKHRVSVYQPFSSSNTSYHHPCLSLMKLPSCSLNYIRALLG